MNPDNIQLSIMDFFNEHIFPDLEETTVALMQHANCYYAEAVSMINNTDYRVFTDNEAHNLATEYAEYGCYDALREIPDYLQRNFDEEAYVDDLLADRGSLLASYDGEEHEETVNGIAYYIYRQ